jgi:hypothetical protein
MELSDIERIQELTGLSLNTIKSYLAGKTTYKSTRIAIEQAIESLKLEIK